MSERIFGTDGIRGRAGEGWLTSDAVSALGRHVGRMFAARNGARTALLGHDGRRSGPLLEAALARGLSSAGLAVQSAGLISTPGLALLARLEGCEPTAMISASHNPAEDNGIKLFTGAGEKLGDQDERALEQALHADATPVPDGPPPALAPRLEQAYLAHLLEHAGAGLRLDELELVVDCANGGSSRIAPRVFGRLGARTHAIHAEPDGDNINRDCGSTHPASLQAEVRGRSAGIGIALDGDGDRCILVDERGALVHGDGILALCARHMAARGELAQPFVVATVMSNRGLHRALRDVGVGVVTVDVGDRHVVEGLRSRGLQLGGEQSGHIVFGADNAYIGDGVYTALRVLRVMRETGKPLSELAGVYRPFPQVLLNVRVASKPHVSQMPRVAALVREIEAHLGEDGRVLLRYSGTEALARVMIEGPDGEWIERRARDLAERIADEIGG